jgi:chromosome segregation protein
MYLKSLILKGFKSFPDRTSLDFGPGVSVVVGPNGSGKSNVTDALLWAMGEQSPSAIRGSSMQDVIFGGGRGVQARGAAEVEIVLDNSDGLLDVPLGEISILRRLERSGEGEYRLNGARCRLADVIEVLSDTGLGKETHSVISQGRVEAIVTSKPRDRRLLIEEAAGLGKHRKRRRRAQLKLERTQENLDRALDVEREARTRLRPLKRQAEAAELHERLERQMLEVRHELAREAVRTSREQLQRAESEVQAARAARELLERRLTAVVARRTAAESALAQRTERHDALSRRAYEIRSAGERMALRGEQATATAESLRARAQRIGVELEALQRIEEEATGEHEAATADRVLALQEELAQIDVEREIEIEREIEGLAADRDQAARQTQESQEAVASAREAREQADTVAEAARTALRSAEVRADAARREAAGVGAELAAANQFLRSHAGSLAQPGGEARALSDALAVKPGYELALAAALGGRLGAALVGDMDSAQALLDGSGEDGGTALLTGPRAGAAEPAATPAAGTEPPPGVERSGDVEPPGLQPPLAGARRLVDLIGGPREVLAVAGRLLADAWVVERVADVPEDFRGVAVTRAGRVFFGAWGELRQVAEGGAERVLARRNERDALIAASERAAQAEHEVKTAVEQTLAAVAEAEVGRGQAEEALRESERSLAEAREAVRKVEWLIEQRRAAPEQGPLAVRRAQIEGELAAERRQAERAAAERAERDNRVRRLRAQRVSDVELAPRAQRLAAALAGAGEALETLRGEVDELLNADHAEGEQVAEELRACAREEADIQAALRGEGEAVTSAEVAAQRLRDQAAEAQTELREVCSRLELPAEADASGEALGAEQEQALSARLERLLRRREQIGPVNPLAQEEYAEAIAHVEELESRRTDLETALRELRAVIRETDRQIHETFNATFAAAARNFEELAGDVFPGGSGRLKLVKDDTSPRPVLGGQPLPDGADAREAAEDAAEAESEAEERPEEEMLGVEIEITPAGKSPKRLSLLSGGEKSMTALAFLFAVFLARPCPFYVLDEVEAALDDLNLDRFLTLLRRYADRAQFIVITHQKRTMEAADWLYGVSMAEDGVSKVLSRKLPDAQDVVAAAPVA